MDLNHDKQIQSLLCYRYTIGQAGAFGKLDGLAPQSSRQAEPTCANRSLLLAPGFSRVYQGPKSKNRFNGFYTPSLHRSTLDPRPSTLSHA